MKNILYIILLIQFFLISNSCIQAQTEKAAVETEAVTSATKENKRVKPQWGVSKPLQIGIHFVPSTLLNFNNRLRMGFQLNATRWSGGADFSYGTSWMPNAWLEDEEEFGLEDYNFYGLRPEFRYHFATSTVKQNHDQFYVGLEGAFTYFERTLRNNRFELNNQFFRYDAATLKRVRHSVIFKLGLNLILDSSIYIDLYGGFGVAYRQFAYSDFVNLQQINEFNIVDELFPGAYRTWETRWVPDFAAGFRFGIYL